MNNDNFVIVLSSDEQERKILRAMKKIRRCKGYIFMLSLMVGAMLGIIADQNRRIEKIETKKEEMAD